MADAKISQLPVATTPLAGTELVPVVQGGVTVQTTTGAILTGTVPSGTANGVLYLNGSKVVSSGSALTFDGTDMGVGGAPETFIKLKVYGAAKIESAQPVYFMNSDGTNNVQINNAGATGAGNGEFAFTLGGVGEAMRLDSTGLGIGTSSPNVKLTVQGDGNFRVDSGNVGIALSGSGWSYSNYFNAADNSLRWFSSTGGDRMTLDSSGAFGIGTDSPSTYSIAPNLVVAGSGGGGMTIRTSNTSYGGVYFADGVTGDEQYRGYVQYNHSFSGLTDAMIFGTAGAGQMTLDSSGNLGLGVTPSAWLSTYKAFQLAGGSIQGGTTGVLEVYANNFRDSNGDFIYIASQGASRYAVSDAHRWYTAPSGTAGNAISFTQALTLDANRNLLLNGTAAPASGVGTFAIFNGTAPTGSVTDGCVLYTEDVSSSSELKVRDEAGNVTTLSPHNFDLIPEGPSEDMAWSYYSERDGKRINVDMLKAIRLLEKLSGEQLVYET